MLFTRQNYCLLLIMLLFATSEMQAQTLIAGWDFQTTTNGGFAIAAAPNTSTSLQANFGSGTIYLNGSNGSSSWITATSGNQLTAFGGTSLNAASGFSTSTSGASCLALVNSSANGKSMVFAFSMSGYKDLIVSYATQKTSTGFSSQQWEVSNDAISWTPLQTITSIPTSFGVQILNTITALNFSNTAFLKVTFTGATSGTGNNRIDNIQLNATAAQPSPVVTSNSASANVGVPFNYFISATNSPTSYSAIGLPNGLTIDTSTGQISGIPLSFLSTSSISISASNGSGTGSGILILSVSKGNQSISFDTIPTKIFGDSPFNLVASGGASGNAIVYSISDTNVATIVGNIVTIVGVGTTTITASQSGNANYFAAANVTRTLVVNKAPQIISFSGLPTKLITDPPFLVSATGGSSGNPIIFTSSDTNVAAVTNSTISIVGAGITNITASQNGNSNYFAATDVVQQLTVNKLSQVITFSALPNKLISDPPFVLTASGGASGNSILFTSSNPSVASVLGNTVTITGTGVTLITASQNGNTMYDSAQSVSQQLIVTGLSNIATYTFGTISSPTSNASNGVPIANLSLSQVSQGNNANTSQTTINLSSTSASNNVGASGEINAGITARNRNFQVDSSAYFEFTLTPSSGYLVTLQAIQFGSRSTSTGPTTLDIRSSVNNFASSLSTISVLANSVWTSNTPSFTSVSSLSPTTFRIYGYVTGGSGSINTGLSANNWRIDDLKLTVAVTQSYPCTIAASAIASSILCNGGSTTVTVNATNGNGNIIYKINNGNYQNTNIFSGVTAGLYSITVSDSYACTASTTINLAEPAALSVSAQNISGCSGSAVSLIGIPAGGVFSLPNPYIGPATNYTYTYTDSLGCVATSSPATISFTPCAVLNLKLFLESYYIGSGTMRAVLYNQSVSNDLTVVDDIVVELIQPSTFNLIATGTTVLHTNGTASISFPNITGTYYIVIKHRNTIATWSANPIAISSNTNFDFSIAANQAYGSNQKNVGSNVWAFFSGDVSQDENIDLLDLPDVEADIENFVYGYYATDVNGDGNTDLLDMPIIEQNLENFIFSDHPMYILFPETMEAGTKTTYPIADINLSTGSWNFDDALIGTSSSDRKNGAKSVRIQNTGKITMNFDIYIDTSLITISHAKYGSDASSTWALFSSTNNGTSWVQQGANITTNSTALQSASFVVNLTGNVRFQIRKLSGGKLNLDDFDISENTATTFPDNDHIGLGNPSAAVTDISFPDNYLLIKPQYDLAYNNNLGTAAWVAWHLDLNDVGSTPRCDCFATDAQLPSTFFKANSSNYSGTGFDRGHQVPSAQRNNNITNNAVTFLMSNIMPQAPNLNQITWENLEAYSLNLINSGYELYTYSGGYGTGGTGSNGGVTNTIASGNINVPSHYWKIIVALPVGNNDVNRVTNATRVIAVDMPNTQTVNTNTWGYYRTSVDAIEAATGFDFLSNISAAIQTTIEAVIDNGPTN